MKRFTMSDTIKKMGVKKIGKMHLKAWYEPCQNKFEYQKRLVVTLHKFIKPMGNHLVFQCSWLVCFVYWIEISQAITLLATIFWKGFNDKGCMICFHNVSTYGGKVIEYWTIFSLKWCFNFSLCQNILNFFWFPKINNFINFLKN